MQTREVFIHHTIDWIMYTKSTVPTIPCWCTAALDQRNVLLYSEEA